MAYPSGDARGRLGGPLRASRLQGAIEELGYDLTVVIPDRTAMMDGSWREQCTAFTYVEEYRERPSDSEQETLEQIEKLAAAIKEQAGPRW